MRREPREELARLERVRKASAPLQRREERRFPGANGYTQRVFVLYGDRCSICSTRRAPVKAVHAHHVVPKRTIIARGPADYSLVYDQRNGLPLCFGCHFDHEYAPRVVIYRHHLLRGHLDWAAEFGFVWKVEKDYPVLEVA